MSRRRKTGVELDGVLLLDKPAGLTSNEALQKVKRLLNARKAGHTGSLDPIATGLLPLCFGEATKISRFLLEADKHYHTRLMLGQTTTTGDAEGEVLQTRSVAVTEKQLRRAVREFVGEIQQVPPMYSALKKDGQPLYKLARQGIEVERQARPVRVYEISDVSLIGPDQAEMEIRCSRGFYVRSFAEDLGDRLGCGAHVGGLRRLGVGNFQLAEAIALQTLRELPDPVARAQQLLSTDRALESMPEVRLSRDAAYYLCRGQAVKAAGLPTAGWVRLYTESRRFLGVGQVRTDGRVAPKRLFRGEQ